MEYIEDGSPDGKYLLFNTCVPGQAIELWALPRLGDRVQQRHRWFDPRTIFSRWQVVRMDPSNRGRGEVYVQEFP